MAELVLDLAKSAVQGTLTAAKSAIEEETKLKKNMQRDLMLISDEFEMMHSFLNVSKERASDEMVRTLVRQVRNMALDVEDCIEFAVHVDINKSQWWRSMLPSCMLAAGPAAPLNDAVAAIELLKSRVQAMGQRNDRYWNIRDSGSIATEKTHQQAVGDAAVAGILIEARNGKNRHDSPRDLVELIMKRDHVLSLQMISLWGSAGDLGVVSIIKKTSDDPEICRKFRCRAFVKLMQPFNPHKFIQSLMAQFYMNCCPHQGSAVDQLKRADKMMAMKDTELTEEFVKQVTDQSYLVFLEDVSSVVDWEAIRVCLPDTNNGSCVVVHTQQLEVASLCAGQSHRVLELERFSADHSVCVFYNEKSSSPRDNLIELIKKKEDAHTPLQVISLLCGEGGDLEVASIIEKTCDDNPEICKKFRYRAWVKLRHPFSHNEFSESLVAQLCTNYCRLHGSAPDLVKLKCLKMVTDEEALNQEFMKQVIGDERYLLLLEDVFFTEDWDAVRKYLPDKNNGSCIVVHTDRSEVASFCVGQSHGVLETELLSADHSVRVLFKEVEDEATVIKKKDAREWLDKCQRVGRGADIENLRANSLGVRPVYGIAGVGKSYIVKYVYFTKVIEHKPFDKFGWVEVSHPFNIRDFSWNLLLDLHSGSFQYGGMLRIRDPIQECCELLKHHKCLIVIDGLESMEEWDSIKAAFDINRDYKSRIIVIANEESVAKYCSKYCWSVEGLEIEEAFRLFHETASRKPGTNWPTDPSPADIETAKNILHKCGGLPKVIVSLANYIADVWMFPNDKFMQVLENHRAFDNLRNLFGWLRSYFHSCPDSLKPCIFYLSIFPLNYRIRRRRLVWRWITEGYSKDTKEITAEEQGEESFNKLCRLNMIQVPGSTSQSYLMRMPSCQVNGFIREYIISRSMEENLVFALEGHRSVNSQHTGRHLTIGSTWDRDKSVYQSIDFSRLRSLTVFGKWESFFISDNMRIVRVLDLEDALSVTDGDLEQMVKLLPLLKFLSLRGCKEITRLPYSFGSLRKLQTLDIRHTSIAVLPLCITKLQKLQHIRAGTTVLLDGDTITVESLATPLASEPAPAPEGSMSSSTNRPRAATLVSRPHLPQLCPRDRQRLSGCRNGGVEAPRGIGRMMSLHNVSVIDLSAASGLAILEELKNLTQMRKLGVSGVNKQNCKELCYAISCHPHLKSLSILLDNNQSLSLDTISQPPDELQSLKLYGCANKLPSWIKELRNLRKLKLQMDKITQDDVDLLRSLPYLNFLCLCSKDFEYEELRFKGPFRRLCVLEIACNNRIQSVTIQDDRVMQQLEVLKIHCSNVSSLNFCGLQLLRKLREVSLSGLYDERVKQQLQSQLDQHKRKNSKPVLKVESRPL